MNDGQAGLIRAILLLGPTGAGKTPLGEWLQTNGLQGRTCHHFDFGASLRAIAAGRPSTLFTSAEIEFLQRVLSRGALLENENFYLAANILDDFVSHRGFQPGDWLILNGLPRHVGQAQALESSLWVQALIELECRPEVGRERLRRNTGGDRDTRADDHDELVARKLVLYEERTRPLVAHYRREGAQFISLPVHVDMQPREMAQHLELRPHFLG